MRIPGRTLALFGSLLVTAAFVGWWIGCARPPAPPNIVFIVIDTLRADHLPGYGYGIDTSPVLTRLATEGVLFRRVIAPSSWTKTSMASIMTGCNPSRHGVQRVRDRLPDETTTLAEMLSSAGYEVLGVNSNPWLTREFGFAAGFGVYKTLARPRLFATASEVNSAALSLLNGTKGRSAGGPVFLYLHYMEPHAPYLPAAPYSSAPPATVPGRGPLPDVQLEALYRKQILTGPEVQERVIELYDGEIRSIDAAIGELLERLEEEGWLDDAVVVITSDHGESFLEHGSTVHGRNLYPEVYEVPLIFYAPRRLPAGQVIDAQVRSVDIAPTLLELAGASMPGSLDGASLLPMSAELLQDRIAVGAVGLNDLIPDRDYVAVVSPDRLYVREKIRDVVEFYDLRRDPGAVENLGSTHPEVASYAALEDRTGEKTPGQVELDEATREQLESLGYLE